MHSGRHAWWQQCTRRQTLSEPPYLLQGPAAPHQGEGKKRRGTSREQVGAGEKKKLRHFRKSSSRQLINSKKRQGSRTGHHLPLWFLPMLSPVTPIREGKRKECNIIHANVPDLQQAGTPCSLMCMAQRQERIAAFFASMRN